MQTIDLSAHTSRHSVMLLFSPTADDAEFDAMSKRVWARPSVWRDRRTIIYELFFEQTGMVFGRGVSHDATRELAEELGVPRDRFTLVLIGQDGRMIFQSQESLPIGHLVRALDGTTARHEMRS